ncbi:hypothetical protein AX17_005905 [Amanita inopinata Kibby_2008]|nr:hypothetical protein AX17_005905 [Amanita inopinata Kibby_2008]
MSSVITKAPAVLPRPRPDRSYASHPPKSKLAYFFWRRRMWFESTFALTVMEPWEKMVMLTIFAVLFILILTGVVKYLPHRLVLMQRRAEYYLWGHEAGDIKLWHNLGQTHAGWEDVAVNAAALLTQTRPASE